MNELKENYTGANACAAIRITKDGKALYASNRFHDSIAAFSINEDGKSYKALNK